MRVGDNDLFEVLHRDIPSDPLNPVASPHHSSGSCLGFHLSDNEPATAWCMTRKPTPLGPLALSIVMSRAISQALAPIIRLSQRRVLLAHLSDGRTRHSEDGLAKPHSMNLSPLASCCWVDRTASICHSSQCAMIRRACAQSSLF